jgi:murein L,D-transpeptidase YcbB/YkuD
MWLALLLCAVALGSASRAQPFTRPPLSAASQPIVSGEQGLVDAIARLRVVAERGGWPAVPPGGTLRLGDRGVGVAALRSRLQTSGELETGVEPGQEAEFDLGLESAVRVFQTRHGLAVDGVVGRATRAQLDVTVAQRIRQLEINLARRRGLPADLGERFLVLNLASFEIELVEGGAVSVAVRAIVGKPSTPTPLLSTQVEALIVNPYWNIPPTIAAREIAPRVARNPGYLAAQGIRVFADPGASREVDPRTVDWRAFSSGPRLWLRQDPGPRNALGKVSLQFPNNANVCLHGTPDRALFDRPVRALSHGCIRLEDEVGLAARLARVDEPTGLALLEGLSSSQIRSIRLTSAVPIHIVYWTAWIDAAGVLHFRPDVYGYDASSASGVAPRHPAAAAQPPRRVS